MAARGSKPTGMTLLNKLDGAFAGKR